MPFTNETKACKKKDEKLLVFEKIFSLKSTILLDRLCQFQSELRRDTGADVSELLLSFYNFRVRYVFSIFSDFAYMNTECSSANFRFFYLVNRRRSNDFFHSVYMSGETGLGVDGSRLE